MIKVDLNGKWQVSGGKLNKIEAIVPGCVHTDLLKMNLNKDPYFRDNEKELMWIGETEWKYERDFEIDQVILEKDEVIIRFEGLDTLTKISINEVELWKTDNMFRTWEFDIKNHLKIGTNTISIVFENVIKYSQEKNKEYWMWQSGIGQQSLEGMNRIRKMQCNFGWDWGPMCVTCGIWKPVEILAFDTARIKEVFISQNHKQDNVDIIVEVSFDKSNEKKISAAVRILFDGKIIEIDKITVSNKTGASRLSVKNPKLWWPNNLGDQNLYDLNIQIFDNNDLLDSYDKKIGLRTLRLDRHKDKWGESFQFVVNGIPFFAKGANWIPADVFVSRTSDELYHTLIKSAADANMNFLRVWGGGIYEKDIFYDLCDKYGICVWQDFMFACSAYPAFDLDFMENVKAEAEDNVKRIRDHACLALWCGNNEIEQIGPCINDKGEDGAMSWDEYKQLFDKLLPEVIQKHTPGQDYWPSSPHTSGNLEERKECNDPTKGDAHLWDVWHGRKPFEWYRSCEHRFNSEFGFQSFPAPDIIKGYTDTQDRNISSYIMEYHQRSSIGNDAMIQYMLSWFRLPERFEDILWLSQILQGTAMKYAVENWRRKMPRAMGTIYWQINDCWPAPTWSSIDYKGNWKALHYIARDFYSPVLISGVEDVENTTVEIHLTNDLLKDLEGMVTWQLVTINGDIVSENSFTAVIGGNKSQIIKIIDLKKEIKKHGIRDLLLEISFESFSGEISSHNLVLFARPKHMNFQEPCFNFNVEKIDKGHFRVNLKAQKPVLWVWAESEWENTKYSDRFFHMISQREVDFDVYIDNDIDLEIFRKDIKIHSLRSTYI